MRRLLAAAFAAVALFALHPADATAAKGRTLTAGEVYGWTWSHDVKVYSDAPVDGTFWDVAAGAKAWDRALPIAVTMTTDPAQADIYVSQVEAPACSGNATIGCAYQEDEFLPKVDGHPSGVCRIELPRFAGENYLAAQAMAAHEMGHCLGFTHVYAPALKNGTPASVMVTPIDAYNYVTGPTSYDRANADLLYGR